MALSVTVRVKGGRNIHRFVVGNSNPTLAAVAAFEVINRLVMPALRARMPVRSGRLQKSLRLTRVGTTIELIGIFYARLVKIGSAKNTVQGLFIKLVEQHAGAIREAIAAAIRGVGR